MNIFLEQLISLHNHILGVKDINSPNYIGSAV